MEILESQAKEVLDFLMKKHGFSCIRSNKLGIYVEKDNTRFHLFFMKDNLGYAIYDNTGNNAAILSTLLLYSSYGYDIRCAFKVVLPKYSTLEQLLVEIDLVNEIGC